MALFGKKKTIQSNDENLPVHIAFIADGNGRWAKKRGLPRSEGHRRGKDAIKRVLERCYERGIKIVSLYLFSTENFNRPKDEVDYIFNLFRSIKDELKDELLKKDAKVRLMGDRTLLPSDIQDELKELMRETESCKSHILNLGIAYGSRREMINAVNEILKEGKESITEEEFEKHLYTSGLPDPDLIVRASGEQRLSNFMLYQSAYSEFYFPEEYWPDFDKKVVDKCIEVYQSRKRRYGNI